MESSSSQTPLVAEEEALDVAATSLGADPTEPGGDANDDDAADQHNGWDDDGVDEDDLLLAIDEEEVGEDAQAIVSVEEGKGGDDDHESTTPPPPPSADAMIATERIPDVNVPQTTSDLVSGPSGGSSEMMPSVTTRADAVRGDANVMSSSSGVDNKSSPELHRQPSSTVSSSTIENPAKLAAPSTTVSGPESSTSPPLPQPPPVTVLSSSSSSILERRVSVTSSRKHALLAEARDDRARWIRSVPLPYRQSIIEEGENEDHLFRGTELARTHAVQSLPSALGLLRHLYQGGLETTALTSELEEFSDVPIPERIRTAIDSAKSSSSSAALVTEDADDVVLSTIGGGNDVDDADHQSYLRAYRDVIRTLQDPSCAVLVQGMRNFCKKLMGLPTTDIKDVASKIRSYLSGIMPSLSSNPVWNAPKQQPTSSSRTTSDSHHPQRRRALEAFLFGQCGSHLEGRVWNDEAQRRESEWMDRMNDLQFVTPRHLEIACLTGNDDNYKGMDVDELLKESVKVLLSVDAYYSPYDKLQRILALYRSVNAALSRALNSNSASATASAATVKKLPSADDVLPTIILVVLRAKPRRLLYNLRFVEDGASPEALRGEAGYAYTNLYGAVQFLTDLDLNVDGSESTSASTAPDHLSMTADEFRQGLLRCREQAKERLNKPGSALAVSALPQQDLEEEPEVEISPVEVRAARRQGVALDVEWALRFRQDRPSNLPPSASVPQPGLPLSASVSDDLVGVAADVLPLGFARSYNFLTARPDDLRMSDLPQLLEEYRMLVHTTEGLLREKSTRIRSERKAQRKAAEHELYTRVSSVDPSLLVPHSSSASSLKTPGSARSRPSPRATNGAK